MITVAPWAAHLTPAELAAQQGHARYTLALATADPKHAARAAPLLQQAVDDYGPAYARSRAINLPGLAGAHALAGDLDTAAHTAHLSRPGDHRAGLTSRLRPVTHPRCRPPTAYLQPRHQRSPQRDPGGGSGSVRRSRPRP